MRIYKRKDRKGDKKSKFYYIEYIGSNGKKVKESTRTENKDLAEKILAKRKDEVVEEKFGVAKPKKVMFDDFKKEFLGYCHAEKKPKTVRFHTMSIRAIGDSFSSLSLSEVSLEHLLKYRIKRLKTVSPSTVNRELATLNHLFNLAVSLKKAPDNPVKRIKKLKEPPGRIRYLEGDEVPVLLGECRLPYLQLAVAMALNTGMRKGEILAIKKESIDLKNRIIHVTETQGDDDEDGSPKSNERRSIPINGNLFPLLEKWMKDTEGDRLFIIKDFRKAFDLACKRAGIRNFKFHDCRHTFASHLVMQGVSLATVRDLMGHKTIQMTMRYAHLSPDKNVAAVECLVNRYRPENER